MPLGKILAMLSLGGIARSRVRAAWIFSCGNGKQKKRFPWAVGVRGAPAYSSYERAAERLVYTVRRHDRELVGPASETPRETKRLSDLDDTDNLRVQFAMALFYRGRRREDGVHPASVIRRALGEALVQYYPLAGRLRETEGGRLVVDCTGGGVLFVQADADVRLEDLEAAGPGYGLSPPFPCWDQLLFDDDKEGSSASGMVNSPLMLIQVTRLLCGGFVFALRFNHTMCDGCGIAQFMNAVGELARGLPLSVTPVWSRELIKATSPTAAATSSSSSSVAPRTSSSVPPEGAGDMVTRSFTLRASDVAAIKKSCCTATATTFEALAAFLWRARTTALELPPGQDATLAFGANLRGDPGMSLPAGYYGNAISVGAVNVSAAALRDGSLRDAVELVRLAKAAVSAESFRSLLDVQVGRRFVLPPNLFFISDARRLGLASPVDFGWGEPVFAGPAQASFGSTFLSHVKDRHGEDAVALAMVLPRLPMLMFMAEVHPHVMLC